MNEYAKAIESARRAVAEAAPDFMPDRGRVVTRRAAAGAGEPETDAYGVTTEDEFTPEDEYKVPCKYRALSVSLVTLAGGRKATASHVIEMPATVEIEAEDTFLVEERGRTPELTFQIAGRLDTSTDLKLRVAATLQR